MKKAIFLPVALILLFSCFITESRAQDQKISLEDIWATYSFYPASIDEIRSMKDGEHYCILEHGIMINEYSYKTGKKTREIIRSKNLKTNGKSLKIDDYEFNADETQILIATNTESIYRHSAISEFYVYDMKTSELKPLSENGKQRLATFSPDGTKVAFLRKNNIFVKNLATGKEFAVTKDGKYNHIINGTPDWVYEEEFSFTKAFFWSNDSKMIAFLRFDETDVKEWQMVKYGNLYPEQYKYKYPKAGEGNSIVSAHIFDLEASKTVDVDLGPETDIYIPRIQWTETPGKLAVTKLNRLQNELEILLADAKTGKTELLYKEENKYYIDINDSYIFLNDQSGFLLTSEMDGFNHIYYYSMDGKKSRQLTGGKWDVTEFCGVDQDRGLLYYISSESAPINRDLYVIGLDGKKKKKLNSRNGWNGAAFSKTFKYYINTWSDANTPPRYSVHNAKGKEIKVLEDNAVLIQKTKDYGWTPKTFFDFVTEDGVKLNAWMIKPPDFDENKEYPLMMFVYGGPGSQTVENQWGYFNQAWFEMLAQKGYVVVSVDNRGTGARGQEFKKCTYKQLGKLETIDQIASAKYFGKQSYIDASRIGIFGWSYGGYMSTLCMTKGNEYFKAGIAVAPVTNWRYYDNIYTERFMRLPQDNENGYDQNSPINHVKKLKGAYLLVHGTADDNVHIQNSMELADALVKANKDFDMHFYINRNHGIYGGYTRLHLYRKMTQFILDNL